MTSSIWGMIGASGVASNQLKMDHIPSDHSQSAEISSKAEDIDRCLHTVEEIELEATKVLLESEGDENFAVFRSEYQALLDGITASKVKCSKVIERRGEVEKELAAHSYRAPDIEKQSNDVSTLKALKASILRAESMSLSSSKRADEAKNELRQLRTDLANLNFTVKGGVGLSSTQEKQINDQIIMRDQNARDLEIELEMIVSIKQELVVISEKMVESELQRKVLDKESLALKERNSVKKLETDMEMASKEKVERELRELRVSVTIKTQEGIVKQGVYNRASEDITSIESQIKQQKSLIEKLAKDQEVLVARTFKLQQDYDEQMVLTSELVSENDVSLTEYKIKERELLNHKKEVKKVNRLKNSFIKRTRDLEGQKVKEENERKVYRTNNENLVLAIDQKKRLADDAKKAIDDLNRERDILKSTLEKTQIESSKIGQILSLLKQQEATIQVEVNRMVKDIKETVKLRLHVDSELDAYKNENDELMAAARILEAEAENQAIKILEIKRQTAVSETKLKQQQNLLDIVESERKLNYKQLMESQAEMGELKRKLKIMNFQINGYKDDVNSRNASLVSESDALVKLSKDSGSIKEEIDALKSQNSLAQSYIKTQMVEEFKLDQFVKEAEVEGERQIHALELVLIERDSLRSQVLHRNQDINSVFDSIKTNNSSLLQSQTLLTSKLISIKEIREEIINSRVEIAHLSEETFCLESLKRQVLSIDSQILQVENKVKALESELETPINIHRWRTLESSDPKTKEMILIVHTLQKQLIDKRKEESTKCDLIGEKEKIYIKLKIALSKQPGPETDQQLSDFQEKLKDKSLSLRYMTTEMSMYKAQAEEYEYSINGLDHGLKSVNNDFQQIYKDKQ